jgi:DNA-binding SARP family transcriptional activator/tetratricopeptide (TPR) repeat protein
VELRVLGDVEAWAGDRRIEVGHARQRCVLAVLLVETNRVVTVDQLLERVWSEQLPQRGRHVLRTYLSRLRVLLSPVGVGIERCPNGYVLRADPDSVDVHHFHRLLTHARAADEDEDALGLFEQALALWRGEPFTGLETPWLATVRAGLERERLAAQLDHIDVALRHGQHLQLLPELSTLASADPLEERVAGQLMLALYRAGRQAEALAHYQHTRRHLAEELGTDPGPGLRQLHQRILTADPGLTPAAVTRASAGAGFPVVPRQLPAAPWAFTGRSEQLDTLTATLEQRDTVVISVVVGAAGIGKTWLALAWAHQHLDRFPDGQLFVDLHCFSPDSEPMAPAVAVRGFLDALGVDPSRIPADPHAQTGLFRSLVADKRMLLVLDNATDAEQVSPLLPGEGSCTVVVTSRRTLTGVITRHGAHHLTLDTLRDTEARALLIRRLGTARLAAEPEAAAELVELCGGLPLALGLIAGRAHAHPDVSLAELAAGLRELGVEALEDQDPAACLPTVLSWSYRALSTQQQQVFGLLGIAPGPDIGLPATASLTALSPTEAAKMLRGLQEASLLSRDTHGRYSMHDLIRRYATDTAHQQLPEDMRTAGLRRVVNFYLHTAYQGSRLLDQRHPPIDLDPLPPGCVPHPLPDVTAALIWFGTEHPNLRAAQHTATTHTWHHSAWLLAWSLTSFHHRQGHFHGQLAMWRAALDSAAHLPDPAARIRTHRQLGYAYADLGHHEEAIEHLNQALSLAEHHHYSTEQALTHRAISWTWERRGDLKQALDHDTRALAVFRAQNQPVWEAVTLNDVGWDAARLGDYETARTHCQAALTLHQRLHNSNGQASTLDSLGYIAHHTGDHHRAIRYFHQALTLFRGLGHTYMVADSLDRLGHPHYALGQYGDARTVWQEAVRLYREQGRDDDSARVQRQLDDLDGPAWERSQL